MKKTLLILLTCLSLSAMGQNIIYVNVNVSGGANNGTSWANAYKSLSTAISVSTSGGQIWVAKGTYQQASSFSMKEGVAIYGGFTGAETILGQRDYIANLTKLTGGIAVSNNANGLTAAAILDGFTITNQQPGSGMHNISVSPTIRNCIFAGNSGDGMVNKISSPSIINCLFTGSSGSGIYNENNSSPTLINTTIAGNQGNGFFNNSSSIILHNSIVWGGTVGSYTASHSLIKDKTDTNNGNINGALYNETDIFNNYAGGDYKLKLSSPAINVGDNNLYTGLAADVLDIAANRRLVSARIDLGAYEHQTLVVKPDANNIVYVNINADGTGNGSSWTNALKNLADALKYAHLQSTNNNAIYATNPLKIYVAKGTYKPLYSPGSSNFGIDAGRDNAFLLVPNVAIYGGFAGNETSLSERNWKVNQTILSGDLDNNDILNNGISTTINGNNAYHVVLSGGDMGSAILDGFTLTGGSATGAGNLYVAGGLNNYAQDFSRTDGAGIYNRDSGGSFPAPTIRNCHIAGNHAAGIGGGMANYNSSPVIFNSIISNNSAVNAAGGLRNSGNAATKITGSLIYGNTAPSGGGISNTSSNRLTITNCTIAANGQGLNSSGQEVLLYNTIVWDDVAGSHTAQYSLLKDKDYSADGNVSANGLTAGDIFSDFAGGDYALKTGSPAMNRGDNSLYADLNAATLDFSGNRRWISGRIDLGAYENQTVVVTPDASNIVYVNSNADGTGNGSSWASAVTEFQAAVNGSAAGGQVWVAKGTYQPANGNSFSMKEGVAIYGGFVGGETILGQRNYSANVTELTGKGVAVENLNNGLTVAAILDGFSITTRGANGYDGMSNVSVSPTIRNCIFAENNGYGMMNYESSPIIINCFFTENSTHAIHNISNSSPIVINTTITNYNGNAFFNDNSTPVLHNSIVWGSNVGGYTASHSLIKDITDTSNGNISANGLTENDIFKNYVGGDYTLKIGSPAINKGSNALYTGLDAATLDLAGKPRLFDGTIDLGAYENQTVTSLPVSFGKFIASKQNNRVKLEWNTFSETNNEAFIVYRSTDGKNYAEIAQQTSKGSGANNYIADDHHPANGVNYYRLKQKDLDGTVTALGDDAVNFSLGGQEVRAWPNPVTKILNISFPVGKYQRIRLTDVSGRSLQEHRLTKIQNGVALGMDIYPKGSYIIELKGDNGNHLIKVLK